MKTVLFIFLLSVCLFNRSALASENNITQAIATYKMNIQFFKKDMYEETNKLIQFVMNPHLSKSDLLNYFQKNSSQEEMTFFLDIVKNGRSLLNLYEKDDDFEFILNQSLAYTQFASQKENAIIHFNIAFVMASAVLQKIIKDKNEGLRFDESYIKAPTQKFVKPVLAIINNSFSNQVAIKASGNIILYVYNENRSQLKRL